MVYIQFEVVNENGKTVFVTEYDECLPPKQQIDDMRKSGYKFKIDGKVITLKKLNEKLKEINDAKNN